MSTLKLGWKSWIICLFATLASFELYQVFGLIKNHSEGLPSLVSGTWLLIQLISLTILATHIFEILTACDPERPECGVEAFPMVSIHIPIHSEPSDVVLATLGCLSKLHYPNFEVLVIDNNTADPALWLPVKLLCHDFKFRFFHLERWPGYKAGALNFGLRNTDQRATFIAVIDADYQVSPNFLNGLLAHFATEDIAYVQSPQDYRYDASSAYYSYLYYAYKYFFSITMCSRNGRNSIIFGGTMGIIRRKLLDESGGWDENCVTEDAEIGLRFAIGGYRAKYVNDAYGWGLMPLDYASLKRQRFRWAYGGVQILRKYWRELFWSLGSSIETKLKPVQRRDYTIEAVHWVESCVNIVCSIVLWATLLIIIGYRRSVSEIVPINLGILPVLTFAVQCVTFVTSLANRSGCTYAKAWGAYWILSSLTWTVSNACVLALQAKGTVFHRTPKIPEATLPVLRRLTQVVPEQIMGLLMLSAGIAVIAVSENKMAAALYALICILNATPYLSAVFFSLLVTNIRSDEGRPQANQRGSHLRSGVA